MHLRLFVLLASLCVTATAMAYPVAPALPLDKLVEESDLICKAQVVDSKPIEDAWFDKTPGFQPHATTLKVIEVYRGAGDLKK
ncbi:hypothetical protein [Anatilimnocola floriformis]|uniref:hypothetical protein n=1 Tax=Anatilimnocola floriformis TaxID=2948575 RepID=UPI0020C1E3DA|nr:hypothetical protein [Anatilimnocola floriformis]